MTYLHWTFVLRIIRGAGGGKIPGKIASGNYLQQICCLFVY